MKSRILCAALAAALLSMAACGRGAAGMAPLESYSAEDDDDAWLSSDGTETQDADAEAEETPEVRDSSPEYTLNGGTQFLSQLGGYTEDEAERYLSLAVACAESFCGAAFSYPPVGTDITEALSAMFPDGEDEIFDPGNFEKIYAGTDAEVSYYWFTPSLLYVAYDGDLGEILDIYGAARIHAKSVKVPDHDYDAYVYLSVCASDGEWQILEFTAGDLYLPGELTITQSGVLRGYAAPEGEAMASFDFADPEGYLTDYEYGLREHWEDALGGDRVDGLLDADSPEEE